MVILVIGPLQLGLAPYHGARAVSTDANVMVGWSVRVAAARCVEVKELIGDDCRSKMLGKLARVAAQTCQLGGRGDETLDRLSQRAAVSGWNDDACIQFRDQR